MRVQYLLLRLLMQMLKNQTRIIWMLEPICTPLGLSKSSKAAYADKNEKHIVDSEELLNQARIFAGTGNDEG